MKTNENIMITGGLGFIGSHCISLLSPYYNNIVIVDNLSNSNIRVFHRLKKLISPEKLTFINASLHDKKIIEKTILLFSIKTIIHLAGLKSVSESANFSSKYHYHNVAGSKALFDIARLCNVSNLVFSSSATVYGAPLYFPISEAHPLRATNFYAQNKIEIEEILNNDDYFMSECSVKILRYFNPIGAHPSGIIGENPLGIPNNLMPYILYVAKRKLKYLNIYGNDYDTHDGTGVRDYIHIMDLAFGHLKALNYKKRGVHTFNLGTGLGYSVLDVVKTFEETNCIEIPYKIVPRRAGDVSSVFADPSKAKKHLNFITELTLKDMCKHAWLFAQKSL